MGYEGKAGLYLAVHGSVTRRALQLRKQSSPRCWGGWDGGKAVVTGPDGGMVAFLRSRGDF